VKQLLAFVATLALALGLLVAQSAPASANDTNTVDYEEFAAVKIGQSPEQVARIFDSVGVTEYRDHQQLVKKYRVAYGNQRLDVVVSYSRWDGFQVTHKRVHWTWEPNPAHNPATKSEYLAIKAGMTLAQVRALIGSQGTRSGDRTVQTSAVGPYPLTTSTWREYSWPQVGGLQGHVVVTFKVTKGTYVVSSKGGVAWS
jgi:hypothetical protein